MGLNKHQKSLIKPVVFWICLYIVICPLMTLIAGRHWTWREFFIFAAVSVVILGLAGLLYILLSKGPNNDGEDQ